MDYRVSALSLASGYFPTVRLMAAILGLRIHPVSRAERYLKRRYGVAGGVAGKTLKVPISLGTLLMMCSYIPGFPNPAAMCHNDRLFVAASAMAVVCFCAEGSS